MPPSDRPAHVRHGRAGCASASAARHRARYGCGRPPPGAHPHPPRRRSRPRTTRGGRRSWPPGIRLREEREIGRSDSFDRWSSGGPSEERRVIPPSQRTPCLIERHASRVAGRGVPKQRTLHFLTQYLHSEGRRLCRRVFSGAKPSGGQLRAQCLLIENACKSALSQWCDGSRIP